MKQKAANLTESQLAEDKELSDEILDHVSGGINPFADIPRVPTYDYDGTVRKNV